MDKPDPTAERRDEVLKRMLSTPPKPHKPKKSQGQPAPIYVVIDGEIRLATAPLESGRPTEIYRNLDDYRARRPMERQVTLAG